VLVLLGLALGAGFGLYAWRAPKLAQPSGFAAVSRESMLVWNNFGLAVAAGVVLIGTLYPLLVEAAGGGLISVGPPFFNMTVAPLLGVLFLLLPLGPMLTWRVGKMGAALRKLLPAIILAALTLAGALFAAQWRAAPALGLMLGVWLIAGGAVYLWARVQRGEGKLSAKLAIVPLAVWSMSVAHIGAGVLTLGAVAETAFRTERAAAMAPGEGVAFAGRRVTLVEIGQIEGPNYSAVRANFRVDDANGARSVSAERRQFTTSPMPTTEVGILSGFDGDLYLALGERVRDGSGAWTIRLYHNPLVQFIFIGVAMMAVGGVLSLLALARKRRRAS
jgi:cytochrome c-type biogenesis protein CcmF